MVQFSNLAFVPTGWLSTGELDDCHSSADKLVVLLLVVVVVETNQDVREPKLLHGSQVVVTTS